MGHYDDIMDKLDEKNRMTKPILPPVDPTFQYLDHLKTVADQDIGFIKEREKKYKASWKKSGGRSAWFMLARKMDRLPELMKCDTSGPAVPSPTQFLAEDNIFEKIKLDPSGKDGTVLSEIRDLRRYLLMVEAEMMSRGVVKEDGDDSDDRKV
jgi:hypothetical protein